jgi:hypothetical protein
LYEIDMMIPSGHRRLKDPRDQGIVRRLGVKIADEVAELVLHHDDRLRAMIG